MEHQIQGQTSSKGIKVLDELRMKAGRNIPAFSGLDLHSADEFGTLRIKANIEELSKKELLRSLKAGDFVNENKNFSLKALEKVGLPKRMLMRCMDIAYWMIWTIKGAIKGR